MAEAIYNKLTASSDAISVGTYTGTPDEPEGQKLSDLFSTTDFFEVMEANGMNVRSNITKKLLPEMLTENDLVVSMAEEPYIPKFLKDDKKVIWWNIKNPSFVDKEIAEDTYKKIDALVRALLLEK